MANMKKLAEALRMMGGMDDRFSQYTQEAAAAACEEEGAEVEHGHRKDFCCNHPPCDEFHDSPCCKHREEGEKCPAPPAAPEERCVCGHAKSAHIYHEGACRPGYVCQARCKSFRERITPAPPEQAQETCPRCGYYGTPCKCVWASPEQARRTWEGHVEGGDRDLCTWTAHREHLPRITVTEIFPGERIVSGEGVRDRDRCIEIIQAHKLSPVGAGMGDALLVQVNSWLDNIVARIRERIPEVNEDPESWTRFVKDVECPDHGTWLEKGHAVCGQCHDALRERLAEAVRLLERFHKHRGDDGWTELPCVGAPMCAFAAFLAKEKEKG